MKILGSLLASKNEFQNVLGYLLLILEESNFYFFVFRPVLACILLKIQPRDFPANIFRARTVLCILGLSKIRHPFFPRLVAMI